MGGDRLFPPWWAVGGPELAESAGHAQKLHLRRLGRSRRPQLTEPHQGGKQAPPAPPRVIGITHALGSLLRFYNDFIMILLGFKVSMGLPIEVLGSPRNSQHES